MKSVIFYIEDEENINELIGETLNKNNFESYGFLDPLVFFKQIEVKKPDLIVLDLMLPNMNGFEVLNILKNTPEKQIFSLQQSASRSLSAAI